MNAKKYISQLNRELGGDFIYYVSVLDWSGGVLDTLSRTGFYSEERIQQLRHHASRESMGEAIDRLMEKTGTGISQELASLGHSLMCIPTIGVLPTRDFNAWALKSPNGDDICILDVMLWGTVHGIAVSFAECVFAGKERMEGHREAAFFTLLAYLLWFSGIDREKLLELAKDYHMVAKDPHRTFAAGQLILGIIVFVIAHEFAHHALGHLGTPERVRLRSHEHEIETTRYNRNQIDEFDADNLGFRAFLNYARSPMADGKRRLFSQGEIAPLVFFHFLDIYERYISEQTQSDLVIEPRHPSAKDRLLKLMNEFKGSAHDNATFLYSNVLTMFEHFEDFTRSMKSTVQLLRQ